MQDMQTIRVKNRTTLTDYAALCRVALYLAGDKRQAQEQGICIHKGRSGRTFTVTERG